MLPTGRKRCVQGSLTLTLTLNPSPNLNPSPSPSPNANPNPNPNEGLCGLLQHLRRTLRLALGVRAKGAVDRRSL